MAAWLGPALMAGGSLLGGLFGSKASSDAADQSADAAIEAARIQAEAADRALQLQREIYGDQRAIYQDQARMFAPAYGAGTNALAQLSSLYGLYQPEQFAPYTPGTLEAQYGAQQAPGQTAYRRAIASGSGSVPGSDTAPARRRASLRSC